MESIKSHAINISFQYLNIEDRYLKRGKQRFDVERNDIIFQISEYSFVPYAMMLLNFE